MKKLGLPLLVAGVLIFIYNNPKKATDVANSGYKGAGHGGTNFMTFISGLAPGLIAFGLLVLGLYVLFNKK